MRIIYSHRTRGKEVEGVHIREIVKALLKRGHEVLEVCLPGCNAVNNEGNQEKVSENTRKLTFFDLICGKFPEVIFEIVEIFSNFYTYYNLKKAIRASGIASLIYERYSLFTFAGVLAAKKCNIPVILEVNDATSVDRIRKLKLRKIAVLCEQYIFRNADAIVTISTYFKRKIVNSGISEEKISVIPNAADISVFSPEISPDEVVSEYQLNGKTVIGYSGGMDANQGMDFLFEIVDDIVSERKDIVFLIVGDKKRLDPKWEEFIDKRTEIIKLVGKVPHKSVPKYIAAFDIAVLPNSHNYGSPVKVFEYMAMKKPILVPKFLPLEDVVSHGVQGLLFTPGDKNDFRNKIIQLIDDKELRIRLGNNGLNTVRTRHTWDKNTDRILSIYQNMRQKTLDDSLVKTDCQKI